MGAAIFLAVCFGLSAAVIGKIKGSSFFIWFLVGFCLPFMGLAAAVLYRNDNAEDLRECPTCGKVNKLHQQVCRGCGNDLYYPEAQPRQQTLFEA